MLRAKGVGAGGVGSTALPSGNAAAAPLNVKLSGTNTGTVGGTVTGIIITVVDVSTRCPVKYMNAMVVDQANRRDGWLAGSNSHIKYMVGN